MPRRVLPFIGVRPITAVLILALLPIVGACAPNTPASHLVVRIQHWNSVAEVAHFMDGAKAAGVTTVHLIAKHDEDDVIPSGTAFYESSIAPIWSGAVRWDPLKVAVEEAHRRGIKIYAWVPQFHDQVAALAHPEWEMQIALDGAPIRYSSVSRSYFVNPIDPEVQAYERSIVEEIVRNYDVDGIDLDWVRFDGINADVGPVSRAAAMREAGIDPLALDFSLSPDDEALAPWQAWRTLKIANHVRTIRAAIDAIRQGVHLAAFVLPQSFTEVGQDLAGFATVLDEVAPMCYFRDWGFDPSWVTDACMPDVAAKIATAGASTLIIPTLGTNELPAEIAQVITSLNAELPELQAIAWFTYSGWTQASMLDATAYLGGWQ